MSNIQTRNALARKHLNSIQVNERVESDLKEILDDLKNGQKEIISKIDEMDKRLVRVETKLESELPALQKNIDEIKGSQKAQIWTLIGILITAVGGFIVAIGKVVFFTP